MKFLAFLLSLILPFLAIAQSNSFYTGYVYNWENYKPGGLPSQLITFSTGTNTGDNTFTIDNDLYQPQAASQLPLQNPIQVSVLTVTGDNQYIVTYNPLVNTNPPSTVYVIDASNGNIAGTFQANLTITNVIAHPTQASYAYAVGNAANSVGAPVLAIIDIATQAIQQYLTLPGSNQAGYLGLATAVLTQTGQTKDYLYAVDSTDGTISVIDITDARSPSIIQTINLGNTSIAYVAVAPKASPPTAYVSTSAFIGSGIPKQIFSINLETYVVSTITHSNNLLGAIATTSNGSNVYFIAFDNTESAPSMVINYKPSTHFFASITLPQETFINGANLAVTPDDQYLYIINDLTAFRPVFSDSPGSVIRVPVGSNSYDTQFSAGLTPIQLVFSPQLETAIFSATPEIGPATGGVPVTLTGTGFQGTMAVLFGSTSAPFTQVSDTQIVATSPPGEPDTVVPLTVLTTHGKSRQTFHSHHIYVRLIFPPTDLKGFQVKNKFATQTDRVNVLRWDSPTQGDPVVAYRIYRDAQLKDPIAVISAHAPREFRDHNRRGRPYTYYIVAVNQVGHQSLAASVTVVPREYKRLGW